MPPKKKKETTTSPRKKKEAVATPSKKEEDEPAPMPPAKKEDEPATTSPKKKEGPAMSAFERKRLENIANNNAILSTISTTADKIIPKPKAPASTIKRPSTSRPKRDAPKRESARPATRQSSRLAGLDADSPASKRKAEVEAEAETEKAKAKKTRVGGDLSLADIQVEGRKWEGGVGGLAGLKGLRGAQPSERTFTAEDTADEGLKDLRLRMGGLKLYEKWPVNGRNRCISRIYITPC